MFDFFEALRKRALNKTDLRWGFAVNATIEALKETMVGEPIVIKPSKSVARRIFVQAIEQANANGEEVIVLILREEANLTNL